MDKSHTPKHIPRTLDLLTPLRGQLSLQLQQMGAQYNSDAKSSPYRSTTTLSAISSKVNGKKVINQYIVLNVLGKGKFAKVAKVMDQATKAFFAMKVMNKKKLQKIFLGKNKVAYSAVETEIAILKKLVRDLNWKLYCFIGSSKHCEAV